MHHSAIIITCIFNETNGLHTRNNKQQKSHYLLLLSFITAGDGYGIDQYLERDFVAATKVVNCCNDNKVHQRAEYVSLQGQLSADIKVLLLVNWQLIINGSCLSFRFLSLNRIFYYFIN